MVEALVFLETTRNTLVVQKVGKKMTSHAGGPSRCQDKMDMSNAHLI